MSSGKSWRYDPQDDKKGQNMGFIMVPLGYSNNVYIQISW